MDDDNIAQFTALTSVDPHRATQYLRLTDDNLEQAISLYFESPNLDFGLAESDSLSTSLKQPSHSSTAPRGSSIVEPIEIDSEGERSEELDADTLAAVTTNQHENLGPNFEDDEALARRLQEQFYGGAESSDPEGVRAPMARTTETLVGPGANWGGEEVDAAVAAQMLARQRRNVGRPGIFNQRSAAGSIWEDTNADPAARRRDLSRATAGASDASSKSNLLAEMYRPPFELICRLPWDDAREDGKTNEKWMIVNVQDPAIFDCQVLNRDIWKNPEIKETVKENFLFMQYQKDDPAGNSYIQYYFHARDSQDAYPHIAIVDPRTGEQVKVWSGRPVPKPMEFLMQLHEFLDRYSLNPNARNPVAQRKPEKKTVDVDRMTEEEMLEMALQNSLANGGTKGPRDEDPDELTRQPLRTSAKGKEKAEDVAMTEVEEAMTENNPAAATVDDFSSIAANNPHTEPANDPSTTTRIQFRYSGGRQIRRFALSDPVRRIYEWLKATPLKGKEGLGFELTSMGTNLIDQLETSIQDAGLKNGTVMVEFSYD